MVKYNAGVQIVEDGIQEFKVVGSGTVTTTGAQYPLTTDIPKPTKLYKNYVLIVNNKSGQTINNAIIQGKITEANKPLPNTPINTYVTLKAVTLSTSHNNTNTYDITSEEPNPFTLGISRISFGLAASSVSGTIDWCLIGY